MSTTCCPPPPAQQLHDKRYRRVLWSVLAKHGTHGSVPEAFTMGTVGFAACRQSGVVRPAVGLPAGDSNMRSVWLCSRNDVIGNCAVLLAAVGVFGTGIGWPDVVVASIMGTLALQGAWHVVLQARRELRGI